ncbi:arsenite efflux transporter metallochaperone ArsD [Terrabacter sp. NPDC000476]|uniref:arsenite efflux transporter metallochaperone ArsD n=1 Tax=Terrabacter sp. NPDC000476 TaxID=3154258 RepID=UPI00332977C0
MVEIHVYEPALCCNTGVCGPELDERLVVFTADLAHVNDAGGQVQRHNLANDPQAFVTNDAVRDFLHLAGSDGLPLTMVDGVTVLTGAYPTREQLARYAAVNTSGDASPTGRGLLPLASAGSDAGCCSPEGSVASSSSSTGCC